MSTKYNCFLWYFLTDIFNKVIFQVSTGGPILNKKLWTSNNTVVFRIQICIKIDSCIQIHPKNADSDIKKINASAYVFQKKQIFQHYIIAV
jgi:hypothetical protein